jgi:hypothetical protein
VSLPQTMFRTPRITLAKPNVTMMTEMIGCPIVGAAPPLDDRAERDRREASGKATWEAHLEDRGPGTLCSKAPAPRPEIHHVGGFVGPNPAPRSMDPPAAIRNQRL